MKGCTNHGKVDYYDMAPYVFQTAKINLNISLRGILAGMLLRAFNIMGGRFPVHEFSIGFSGVFVSGEDFVYFDSRLDLMDKITYYLVHEEERQQIAENGYRKIAEAHTYRHRVREMMSYL